MHHAVEHGVVKSDRTGTGKRIVFSHQMRVDPKDGSPESG